MTDLTIIIVSWNTREMTLECLRSVRDCAGALRLQVILVDNHSADGTAEAVAKEFPEVELILNSDNRGFAAANNQALLTARGEQVLLLNSDTIVLGHVLEDSVAYLRSHPRVGAMGCRVLNTDRTVQLTCAMQPTIRSSLLKMLGLHRMQGWAGSEHYRGWLRDSERDVGVVTGCYLMAPRAVIEAVGPLDEQFFFNYEETDWCRRIADAGHRVVFAPVGEIIHHGGGSSGADNPRREIHLIRGKVQFFRKHRGRAAAAAVLGLAYVFWTSRMVLAHLSPKGSATRFSRATTREVLRALPRLNAMRHS